MDNNPNHPHPLQAALKILCRVADQQAVVQLDELLDGLIAALARDLASPEAPDDRDTQIMDCAAVTYNSNWSRDQLCGLVALAAMRFAEAK